jgi:hypothetical protein
LYQYFFSLSLPAFYAYNAYMEKQATQYTLRNVPAHIDRALRRLAKKQDTSINQLLLDILERVVTLAYTDSKPEYRDLDALIGSWIEDPEFDGALKDQSQVDPDLWK